jgi:hypothetical protein
VKVANGRGPGGPGGPLICASPPEQPRLAGVRARRAQEVCDVPSGLADEAAQLIGGEGVALMTSETQVFDAAGQALTGDAAATALAGADSVSLKAQPLRPAQWRQDEDGQPVPTFRTSRADITD